ncbi:zona pellucida sperm-binding protein 2-like isoform X1 [Mauremys mutica]|uniref:zona pellucida sperm-binding protein 2-like isoform X1 n=1 Tax=Mauremys mutica TaxID=74926 RepID=UPI001D1663DA|nr:zona pellucida sperm-binding protein 2-like isoform X1 [Mauremys mutica]
MVPNLVLRLFLIGVLASEIWTQDRPGSLSSECLGSLLRVALNAEYFEDKYLIFAVVDQFGTAQEIDETLAAQCGYTIEYNYWGNIEFRASIISCYTHIESDVYTLTVQIQAANNPDMKNALTHLKIVSCPYSPWHPRELVCETNYMEVSVRRNVPQITADVLQDEPEDWALAFPEATAGAVSIWQVVFHLPTGRKALLASDAQNAGYGLNTTDTRILLRAPYNATEAQLVKVRGVTFSAVRASTFYKQRWMILMVDTAVACPIDGMEYTDDTIIWTIPKNLQTLSAGATSFNDLLVEIGVDLHKLSAREIASRKYVLSNNTDEITIQMPIGAEGGYYKTHVSEGQHGTKYYINLFLEHQWEDNRWGVTKHTIIKKIETPFKLVPPTITNNTNSSIRLVNVTVGTFLPDVELVNLTIDDTTVTVPEALQHGYKVYETRYPNGSKGYIIETPFDVPSIKKEYLTEDTRLYTLNVTLGFIVQPTHETFTVPVITISPVKDAVLPSARGFCDDDNLYLTVIHGNVDQNWLPFISNLSLSSDAAQKHNYGLDDNGTHLTIRVPLYAPHVLYEEIHPSGITASLHLTMKDNTHADMIDFSISCRFSPKELIGEYAEWTHTMDVCLSSDCLPNGTMVITALKLAGITDLDTSLFVLRDKQCRPVSVTEKSATFIFNMNTCGTSRKFEDTVMTYENEVSYFRPGSTTPIYQLKCACQYIINETIVVQYSSRNNPAPSVEPGFGSLALTLRLFKDQSYSDSYVEIEYPVVKYLKEALYFEVELLHSEDPQLELYLEDCWATTSQDRDSSPQWSIITDSCENAEDSHQTIFHKVDSDSRVKFPTHLKRFEVKMFTFMQDGNALLEQIYFHCSVVICDARRPASDLLCARRCIPRKQRLGRSVEAYHMHGHVSSGAVLMKSK